MTDIERLADWLKNSNYTTVFSGAGASTESGLPDFRSSGGLWTNNRRFEELASVEALAHDYDEFVAFYRWRITELQKYAPHEGHYALARLQHTDRIHALITQNVDGFHQRAGSPGPFQLHGGLDHVRCHDCGHKGPALTFLEPGGHRCVSCGGKMRPGVVLFGERLPQDAFAGAQAASEKADLFIVLGSSLLVSPANMMPEVALMHGAKLVIVNQSETPLTSHAALAINAPIGPLLAELESRLAVTGV